MTKPLHTVNIDAPAVLVAVASGSVVVLGSWTIPVLCGLALLLVDMWPQLCKCLVGCLRSSRIAALASVTESKPGDLQKEALAATEVAPDVEDGKLLISSGLKIHEGVQSPGFVVSAAGPSDVEALNVLYQQDYLQAHMRMHGDVARASTEEWETALGPIDFASLLDSRGCSSEGDVRLLTCVEDDNGNLITQGCRAGDTCRPVGYVLYELREKGSPGKRRQRFCELVNIVVNARHRGCGAGRLLFDALCDDLAATAPGRAGDLRLFVAERNVGPREWYKRLGFKDAGWQIEHLAGKEVRFVRMMRSKPS